MQLERHQRLQEEISVYTGRNVVQMKEDEETRSQLAGLGAFVEKCLTRGAMLDDKDAIIKEAKQRFSGVRERLLSTFGLRWTRISSVLGVCSCCPIHGSCLRQPSISTRRVV